MLIKTKIISSVAAVIIILIALLGGWLYYRQLPAPSLGKITYGYQTWPGVLPYLVAYDQGFFKENGLDVQLVKEDSYVQEIADLVSGKVDFIGDIALIDVVRQVSQGKNLKVVLATDYSNGADGLVAKKEIKSIFDLKNKKIAVEQGTLGEYLLHDALKKNNLNLSDVTIVNLSAQEAAQAFIRGEVEAAVTYEPDYSQAVDRGNGWRLYTSADSPGLIIDVLAFRSDFVLNNQQKISAVVAAYIKAMDFIATNPEQSYRIGAKYFNLTPEDFKQHLGGIKLMDLFDNSKVMSYRTSLDSLHGAVIQANTFLRAKGAIINPVDSLDIIDATFIRTLTR